MNTKVLYFVSNTKKNYYNIYMQLKEMYEDKSSINVDDVDYFLNNLSVATEDEKFYVKELPYQLEIYNAENEYVFCINKPTYPNKIKPVEGKVFVVVTSK